MRRASAPKRASIVGTTCAYHKAQSVIGSQSKVACSAFDGRRRHECQAFRQRRPGYIQNLYSWRPGQRQELHVRQLYIELDGAVIRGVLVADRFGVIEPRAHGTAGRLNPDPGLAGKTGEALCDDARE